MHSSDRFRTSELDLNLRVAFRVLGLSLLALGWLAGLSISSPAQEQHQCNPGPLSVQLSQERLARRALHRVEPTDPLINSRTIEVDATVTVHVEVDEAGRVTCAAVVGKAHPLLGTISAKAAQNWTFKPLVKHGHSKPMGGEIVFHIKR
jgi:hypothetical protein